MKELAERRKGGRREVQKSTRLKWTFLFSFLAFSLLFPSEKRERKKDNRERMQLDGQKSHFLFEQFQFSL